MAFTYRPDQDVQKEIEKIKKSTGIKVNSKVLDHTLKKHLLLESQVSKHEKTINTLEQELKYIKSILRKKTVADANYKKLIIELSEEDNSIRSELTNTLNQVN